MHISMSFRTNLNHFHWWTLLETLKGFAQRFCALEPWACWKTRHARADGHSTTFCKLFYDQTTKESDDLKATKSPVLECIEVGFGAATSSAWLGPHGFSANCCVTLKKMPEGSVIIWKSTLWWFVGDGSQDACAMFQWFGSTHQSYDNNEYLKHQQVEFGVWLSRQDISCMFIPQLIQGPYSKRVN